MIAENETFIERVIFLDGCSFKNCSFIRCKIVYSGLMGVEMEGQTFEDCTYHLKGAAQETIAFLSSLYKAGGKDLVEGTFRSIRGDNSAGPRLN